MTAPAILRPAIADDMAYIRHSWVASFVERDERGRRSPLVDALGIEAVLAHHRAVCDRLLARSQVMVAGLEQGGDAICGWTVTEGGEVPRIHYVYVKRRWRRLGVARALLAPFLEGPAVFTHRTPVLAALALPKDWSFDPYLAFLDTKGETHADRQGREQPSART